MVRCQVTAMSVIVVSLLFSSLCFLPLDSGQQVLEDFDPLQSLYDIFDGVLNCNNTIDCEDIAYSSCVTGFCECNPGYQYYINKQGDISCIKCPGIREPCHTECCYPSSITECRQNVCRCAPQNATAISSHEVDCSGSMEAFKLATQIALGSSLILAIACLLAILWKSCKRRRAIASQASGTVRTGRRARPGRRTSSQASLSSGQLRVAELLRDRPPGYYDRTHVSIEKPPTYEETLGQPQRYPILSIDIANNTVHMESPAEDVTPEAECPVHDLPSYEMSAIGVDNAAFVIDTEKSVECDSPVNSDVTPELHM